MQLEFVFSPLLLGMLQWRGGKKNVIVTSFVSIETAIWTAHAVFHCGISSSLIKAFENINKQLSFQEVDGTTGLGSVSVVAAAVQQAFPLRQVFAPSSP